MSTGKTVFRSEQQREAPFQMILTPSQRISIQREHAALEKSEYRDGFEYPWNGLDNYLAEGKTLLIAGYGSLMNRTSAARTFAMDSVRQMSPVVVFHARRVYDKIMSPAARKSYPTIYPETHCGVLNAYVTGNPEDCFNAVLLPLKAAELDRFRSRESGYDLLPVVTVEWDAIRKRRHCEPKHAFVLSCRTPVRFGQRQTHPQLQPHPLYHEICLRGARDISDDFLEMFHRTTQIVAPAVKSESDLHSELPKIIA
jgi:hypothetical protein